MNVRSQVAAAIEAVKPRAVCDACLALFLHLDNSVQAGQATRLLAGDFGFCRSEGACAGCGQMRYVITKTGV